VHYTGWLRDGTKFDSSLDRGEPFKFVQGRRQVITGWEMGFEGMKVGGKRRLFLPVSTRVRRQGASEDSTEGGADLRRRTVDVKDVTPAPAGAECCCRSMAWKIRCSSWRIQCRRRSTGGVRRRECGRSRKSSCTSRWAIN